MRSPKACRLVLNPDASLHATRWSDNLASSRYSRRMTWDQIHSKLKGQSLSKPNARDAARSHALRRLPCNPTCWRVPHPLPPSYRRRLWRIFDSISTNHETEQELDIVATERPKRRRKSRPRLPVYDHEEIDGAQADEETLAGSKACMMANVDAGTPSAVVNTSRRSLIVSSIQTQ